MHQKIHFLTEAALIAALYTVLTVLSAMLGLSGGVIQLRLSEALTVLAALTPAAIPGVFVGCIIANIFTGCLPWDILLGSLATLIGLWGTRILRHSPPLLLPLPTILANTLIIPAVLVRVYRVGEAYPILMLSVGIGEILSAGVLGLLLYYSASKSGLFRNRKKP